jgi:hypothetical protein
MLQVIQEHIVRGIVRLDKLSEVKEVLWKEGVEVQKGCGWL